MISLLRLDNQIPDVLAKDKDINDVEDVVEGK
jgi:hypothetical protein